MRSLLGFIFILIFAFGCGKKAGPHTPGNAQNGEPATTVVPPTTPPVVKKDPAPVVKKDSPPVVKKEPEIRKIHAENLMATFTLHKDKDVMGPFMGKQMIVIGTVAEVDRERNIVTLKGDRNANVLCFFGSATADVADCKVGRAAQIKGTYSGTNAAGHAQILKCELVASEDRFKK